MRCHICNNPLSSKEIKFNQQNKIEPCFRCKALASGYAETWGDYAEILLDNLESTNPYAKTTNHYKQALRERVGGEDVGGPIASKEMETKETS
jgi:hypothetical protein